MVILPLELVVSKRKYRTINRWLMGFLFFLPL